MYCTLSSGATAVLFSTMHSLSLADLAGIINTDHICSESRTRVQSKVKDADGIIFRKENSDTDWTIGSRAPPRVLKTDLGIRVFPLFSEEGESRQIVEGENPLVDFLARFGECNVELPCRETGLYQKDNVLRIFHIQNRTSGASSVFVGWSNQIDFSRLGLETDGFDITHQIFSDDEYAYTRCSGWYEPSWKIRSPVLLRKSTGLPKCLVDIVGAFVGTWTVDFNLLLPRRIQDIYNSVSVADNQSSYRSLFRQCEQRRIATRLAYVMLLPKGQFSLCPPSFVSELDGKFVGYEENDGVHWVALVSLIRGLCDSGCIRIRDKRASVSDVANMLLELDSKTKS